MKLLDRLTRWLMAPQPLYISLAPETYSSGGFLDNVDVTLASFKFIVSTGTSYDKANTPVTPLLSVTMQEGSNEARQQYFPCGNIKNWEPSRDGETLDAMVDGRRLSAEEAEKLGLGIHKTCKAALFLASLYKPMEGSGVPASKLNSGKISDLNGIRAHIARVDAPKYGLKRENGKEDKVIVVTKILSVPWETTGQSQAKTIFGDTELLSLAEAKLKEKGGTLKKEQLAQLMMQAVPSDAVTVEGKPARVWAVQRACSDEFLNGKSAWSYDGSTVSLVLF